MACLNRITINEIEINGILDIRLEWIHIVNKCIIFLSKKT